MTESLDGSLLPLVLWFVGVMVVGILVSMFEDRGGGLYVDPHQGEDDEPVPYIPYAERQTTTTLGKNPDAR